MLKGTTPDPYDGPERLGTSRREEDLIALTKDEFAEVMKQVGHEVGRVHRRRMAIQCCCLSLIVCAVGIWLGLQQAKNSYQASARYDCLLVRALASPLSDFVSSDTQARLKQSRGNLTPALLHDLEHVIPLHQLQRLSARSQAYWLTTALHWQTVDLPKLQRLETLDCAASAAAPPTHAPAPAKRRHRP